MPARDTGRDTARDTGKATRMSLFSRYVFRQAAGAFLLIVLSLTGVVWIALALRQLNVVTTQGQDAWMLIKITTLALPNLMAIISPFALLISVMHTLNRLNGDSELIVMTASGATVWNIARPLVLLAALVAAGVAFVNHAAQPWSLQLLREYIVQVRSDLLTQVIQPGRFSSPEANLTFHIRERAVNGDLLGLIMHDARDPKLVQSYLAEHGIIVKQPPSAYLVMTNGHIVRREDPKQPPRIIVFDKYAVDLDRFDQKNEESQFLKPRELYTGELIGPDKANMFFKQQPGQFRAELHERFSNPLYPVLFVLIALATVGQAQSTRQNRVEKIVVGFVAAAGARLAGMAVNNLVAIKSYWLIAQYGLPIVGIVVALVLMRAGSRPRSRRLGLIDRASDALADLVEAVRVRTAGLTARRPRSAAR